jgi:hypothetical protein
VFYVFEHKGGSGVMPFIIVRLHWPSKHVCE